MRVDEVMLYGVRNEVPVFMKQWGSVMGRELGLKGKAEDWDKWPPSLGQYKRREWPKVYEEYLLMSKAEMI